MKHLFGEIALELKLLTAAQLERALARQRSQPEAARQRIGEILAAGQELRLRDVTKILLLQKRRRQADTGQLIAPRSVGPYEVLTVLGSGGMASVYTAREQATGQTVAVKVLAPALTHDSEFLARFEREVTAVSGLQHPNIVACLGAGRDAQAPYLVMEYVQGPNLGAVLKARQALPEARALEIAQAMALALDHAHGRGIVHRDVKPENILLGEDGAIKLTDFGLAKLLRDERRLTQTGMALGTPHYISPEQVAGEQYIDHRADLYSLGAVLYHMLTGKVPFDGPNQNEIMLMHMTQRVPNPRDAVRAVSRSAAAVTMKLLAKKAAERYDSAAQAAEDLERAAQGRALLYALTGRPSRKLSARPGCALLFALSVAFWYLLVRVC